MVGWAGAQAGSKRGITASLRDCEWVLLCGEATAHALATASWRAAQRGYCDRRARSDTRHRAIARTTGSGVRVSRCPCVCARTVGLQARVFSLFFFFFFTLLAWL